MKKDIHPKYHPKAKAKCACGAVFEIGSTQESINIEICSHCHPFYTGKEKIIETGQVEKFKARLAKKKTKFGAGAGKSKKAKKKEKRENKPKK